VGFFYVHRLAFASLKRKRPMTGVIANIPRQQFLDALGIPLIGGKIFVYQAGSTTPADTFQDQELTTKNANPIPLDATGSCTIWLDQAKQYKFLLKNALGVTQPGWPIDNVSGASSLTSLVPTLGQYAKLSALAAAVGSSLIGYSNGGTTPITLEKALDMMYYGWADVRNPRFAGGADPSFTAEQNTKAIQAAIDACPFVHFPGNGVYVVTPDMTRTNQDNAAGICIDVKTGTTLDLGQVTIQQKAGTSCASIIGNSTIISNVTIQGGIVDGNRTGTVASNTCAVVLFHATDCVIRNVTAKEAQLIGVGFRNINTGYGRNRVDSCKVYGSNYIGIQCRYQDLGVEITDCIVENTNDNAIDVEGSGGSQGIGNRVIVTGNRCYSFRQGIFMESVGEAIITNNYLQNFSLCGITLNTINANTGLRHVIVANNQIRDGAGQIGLWIRNTSSRISVHGNFFSVMKYSIECTAAGGNSGGASYVSIGTNMHEGISHTLIHLPQEPNALVFSRLQKQDYIGNKDTGNGKPFTISPISNAFNYPNRTYRLDATPTYFMSDGATAVDLESEYKDGATATLTQNAAWSNAYSSYSNNYNASFETLIYVGAGTLIAGRYVKINGTFYKVGPNRAAGVYAIQGASGSNANFTANLNAAYVGTEYFAEWQEA
jgi:hypothetical protein